MEKKSELDISKFDIRQMYNNSKGKTSLALVCGHQLICCGCSLAIAAIFEETHVSDLLLNAVALCTLGATLLGIRRFTKDKEVTPPAVDEETAK